jgi:hypothetical protein
MTPANIGIAVSALDIETSAVFILMKANVLISLINAFSISFCKFSI